MNTNNVVIHNLKGIHVYRVKQFIETRNIITLFNFNSDSDWTLICEKLLTKLQIKVSRNLAQFEH